VRHSSNTTSWAADRPDPPTTELEPVRPTRSRQTGTVIRLSEIALLSVSCVNGNHYVKRVLAAELTDNREAYSQAKSDFIRTVLN
jgi:hypothetical protein